MDRPHVLFVCARNQWRSPTAEAVYRNDPRVSVRSAGVSEQSRRKLGLRDLEWADLILVMERKHKSRIHELFRNVETLPPIECLEIPDEFELNDPALIQLITERTEACLAAFFAGLEESHPQ